MAAYSNHKTYDEKPFPAWLRKAGGLSFGMGMVGAAVAPPEHVLEFSGSAALVTGVSLAATGAIAFVLHARDHGVYAHQGWSDVWKHRQRNGLVAGMIISAAILTTGALQKMTLSGKETFKANKIEMTDTVARPKQAIDMNGVHPE